MFPLERHVNELEGVVDDAAERETVQHGWDERAVEDGGGRRTR